MGGLPPVLATFCTLPVWLQQQSQSLGCRLGGRLARARALSMGAVIYRCWVQRTHLGSTRVCFAGPGWKPRSMHILPDLAAQRPQSRAFICRASVVARTAMAV